MKHLFSVVLMEDNLATKCTRYLIIDSLFEGVQVQPEDLIFY